MDEIIEEMFSGYCKAHNQTKIITCEYSKNKYGELCLKNVDCDFWNVFTTKNARWCARRLTKRMKAYERDEIRNL